MKCTHPHDNEAKMCRACWRLSVKPAQCSAEECERASLKGGLCNMHYQRVRYRPTGRKSGHQQSPKSLEEYQREFWQRVAKGASCWVWTGGVGGFGYGQMPFHGKTTAVHRLSYEWAHGEIPAGFRIDHLCRNILCVNPDHLEAVTDRVNILRGIGATARNARKRRCPRGHEYSTANTFITKQGWEHAAAPANAPALSAAPNQQPCRRHLWGAADLCLLCGARDAHRHCYSDWHGCGSLLPLEWDAPRKASR